MAILEEYLRSGQRLEEFAQELTESLLSEFPWVEHLPIDAVKDLVRELLDLASRKAPIEEFAQFIHDWKATAEAYQDPDAVAELLESADDEEPVPLHRQNTA